VVVAKELGLKTIVHPKNRGYGGNQKSCYKTALEAGADIVIMLHPDYQYTPKLVSAMAYILESGLYDVVLGSRILGGQALKGGVLRSVQEASGGLNFGDSVRLSADLTAASATDAANLATVLQFVAGAVGLAQADVAAQGSVVTLGLTLTEPQLEALWTKGK